MEIKEGVPYAVLRCAKCKRPIDAEFAGNTLTHGGIPIFDVKPCEVCLSNAEIEALANDAMDRDTRG